MIQASELRRDNLVSSIEHDGLITQVHSIMPNQVRLYCNPMARYEYRDINPIPLTQDLLLKCGFSLHSETEFAINYILPNGIAISYVLKSSPIAERGQFIIGETHDEIAYLHMLQNYIYFRYNTELIINL